MRLLFELYSILFEININFIIIKFNLKVLFSSVSCLILELILQIVPKHNF